MTPWQGTVRVRQAGHTGGVDGQGASWRQAIPAAILVLMVLTVLAIDTLMPRAGRPLILIAAPSTGDVQEDPVIRVGRLGGRVLSSDRRSGAMLALFDPVPSLEAIWREGYWFAVDAEGLQGCMPGLEARFPGLRSVGNAGD